MPTIIQLDEKLANQIAAGEVVERPANVVKELVENSIDAKALAIDVFIENGGVDLIKVVDNGIGMDKEDAIKCFDRHATSKIRSEYELFRLSTLGFRGEAIPSIASVSHFQLKTSQGVYGTEVIYEYGDCKSVNDSDGKKGTTITVTKLFHNLPARLKYLKSVNAEYSAILNYMERLALSHPEISFGLYHNDRQVFKTQGNNNLLEVISNVYGLAVAKSMLPIEANSDEYYIQGFISKIDTNRSSKANIITLMNHRVVRNQLTIDAINGVYRDYLASDRYPIAIVNIDVEPYLIDVNVHPAKLEVRLSKEEELKELIIHAVRDTLDKVNIAYRPTEIKTFPKENIEQQSLTPSDDYTSMHIVQKTDEMVNHEIRQHHEVLKDVVPNYETTSIIKEEETPYVTKKVVKEMKEKLFVKGQIHGTYIVCENENNMYLIDQHAGQERINYEYYLEKFLQFDDTMQDLLVPINIELTKSEFETLNERKDLLKEVGIQLDVFGNQSFICKQLPFWMRDVDEKKYIDDMVEQILINNQLDIKALRKDAVATLSCKASLKANMYLTQNDMQTLVDNLMRCDQPYTCPHGRPTMIRYSSYDLEKLFKRVK